MKRKSDPQLRPEPIEPAPIDEMGDDDIDLQDRIVARPDGIHWLARDGRQEFGPFETVEDALADMQAADDESPSVPGETLQEAEDEIGIADWIDPETGEPAEESPPRLQEE